MLIFFDLPATHQGLFPLTFTRPTAELRIGILRIREKWEKRLREYESGNLTASWLAGMFPFPTSGEYLYVNGNVCPSEALVDAVKRLERGQGLLDQDQNLIALRTDRRFEEAIEIMDFMFEEADTDFFELPFTKIERPSDIFHHNRQELTEDFHLLTAGRTSQPITDPNTAVYAAEQIFLEEGAEVRAATLNAEAGPIYIGKNARIEEGCMVRGAFALCENATLHMGAKLRGDTTVGPYCKVGGEVSNSVLMGYSNKGHEGFLGNSVLGEWCNLGADTNISNLKNNYSEIRVWDYNTEDFVSTGLIFHGLIMGDHAKCGINTMFNTGTLVGVGANVFGGGFPPKFVPSFSWGGAHGLQTFQLPKFFDMASRMMQRRDRVLTSGMQRILEAVFEKTDVYRG